MILFKLSSPTANGEQETNGHENESDNQIKGGLALGSLQVRKIEYQLKFWYQIYISTKINFEFLLT